jgi:hypothetical protein
VVFCEMQCRHGEPCEHLIAADRPHPVEGAYLAHQATDPTTGKVHSWKSLPKTTQRSRAYCEVWVPKRRHHPTMADQDKPLIITVRLP